jgi:hypothetical protein
LMVSIGGAITVSSQVGQGSIFTISVVLPVIEGASPNELDGSWGAIPPH